MIYAGGMYDLFRRHVWSMQEARMIYEGGVYDLFRRQGCSYRGAIFVHRMCDFVALAAAPIEEALLAHVEADALEAPVAKPHDGIRLADVALYLQHIKTSLRYDGKAGRANCESTRHLQQKIKQTQTVPDAASVLKLQPCAAQQAKPETVALAAPTTRSAQPAERQGVNAVRGKYSKTCAYPVSNTNLLIWKLATKLHANSLLWC